jgi:hypothetical protein
VTILVVEQGEFWELVATLGARPDDSDFERLTSDLAGRDQAEIIAFEDHLALVLHALDTPAHAKAARAHNDWFLYVRCAAVAAGRDAYEAVQAEPAKLRRFARREAELLLSVASQAYERSTGRLWEHVSAVSYESGTNVEAWGEPDHAPEAGTRAGETPWVAVRATTSLGGSPRAYPFVAYHVGDALSADPAWQAWWAPAGVAALELILYVGPEMVFGPAGTTIKVGRGRVEATQVRPVAAFPESEPSALLAPITEDLRVLLEAVRSQFGLGPLPEMVVPQLPADLPTGREETPGLRDLMPAKSVVKAIATLLFPGLRKRQD